MPLDQGRIQGFGSDGTRTKVWHCPSGHMLQPWKAQPGHCDGCRSRINRGDCVMDCRKCNWYLCAACHPHEQEQEESGLWSAFNSLVEAAQQEMQEIAQEFQEMATEAETFVNEMMDSVSCIPSTKDGFNKDELDLSAQVQQQHSWSSSGSKLKGKGKGKGSCKGKARGKKEEASVVPAPEDEEEVKVAVDDKAKAEEEEAAKALAEPPKPPADLMDFGQHDLLDLDAAPTSEAAPAPAAPAQAQAQPLFDLLDAAPAPKAAINGAGAADELLDLSSPAPGPTLLHVTGAGIPAIPPPPSVRVA